ncbi:DUF4350 domain-containing protein [Agromyces mediolanus]|uniref:DUF4350 domain-containing protein n=1 Tax=Agromyces mediolanus TaxID=41986 RepID=UPI002040F010|nr:DUF4350 domain-containing protein [Agromyces mediolanus]MCM3656565.1 DUF4350 domain-containing protein [Agromyces mediolanus]
MSRREAPPAEQDAAGPAQATSLTPTLRGGLRRARTWIAIAAVAILGAAALILLQGAPGGGGPALGADNPGPAGAKAVVEVLRAQGVDVREVSAFDDAEDAARAGATVVVADSAGFLDPDRLAELSHAAERLVVVEPGFASLSALVDGVRLAGAASGAIEGADCRLPAAERAGTLSDGQRLLRVDDEAQAEGWQGCFPDGEFGVAVAEGPSEGGRVAIVAAATAFANDTVDEAGNAALALGLLGQTAELAWYVPGIEDVDASTAPTLGELTPGWVTPTILLAIVLVVVAAVWRGRRFGPLVAEDLVVDVPVAETREGRARLYERSAVRTHALDQLRIGALGRLTGVLKLPRSADAREIALAAALATGRDPYATERLLVGEEPADDRRLVELAAGIHELEAEVRRTLRPDADLTQTTERPGRPS